MLFRGCRFILVGFFFFNIAFLASAQEARLTKSEAFQATMLGRPLNGLRGNCLGSCKAALVSSGLLPEFVLRDHKKNKAISRQSHEGIFSDDLFSKPYAMERLFLQLGIDQEDISSYLWMVEAKSFTKAEIEEYVYLLVEAAMEFPEGIIPRKLIHYSKESARPIFYAVMQDYFKQNFNRNLEFWNVEDKAVYNIMFGEFNFAWMSLLDIFESEEINPNKSVFKRIFPVNDSDLGVAVYTPNKEGPDGALSIDLRNAASVPSGSLIVYRVGSDFTRGTPFENELDWESLDATPKQMHSVDGKPGHIEACVYKEGRKSPYFCSDGRVVKPATEWSLNREVLAIYLPVI